MGGVSDNDVIDEDPVEENDVNQVVDENEEKNDEDLMVEEEDLEFEEEDPEFEEEEDNTDIEEESEEEEENDDIEEEEEEEDNDDIGEGIEEEDNGDEQEEKINEEDAIEVAKKNGGGTGEEEAETVKGEEADNKNEKEVNNDNDAQEQKTNEDVREEKTNGEEAIVVTNKNEGGAEEETKTVKSEEKTKKLVDANPTQNVRKSNQRNRKKKVTQGAVNNVVSKEGAMNNVVSKEGAANNVSGGKDKPESSKKKKTSKKVESMGMIFMCTSKTKQDCYRYKLLGLPAGKKDLVEKIYKGMRLFLFDLDLRLLYGIYKAAGPGGSNIEPKAFKSAFPSQVRFAILEDCLPLAEEKFKDVIKENYYSRNKFHCELTSEQVKRLCKLFVSASKGSALHKPSKNLAERVTSGVQHRSKRRVGRDVNQGLKQRGQDEERGRKRKGRDEESSRKRKRRDDERGRKRKVQDEDRGHRRHDRPDERGLQRNHERRVTYTTEVFPSQVAPRLGAARSPIYGYERTLERSPFRRELVLEHRGLRRVDPEPRHHDEARSRDPYVSYGEQEALSYRSPVYSTEPQREYYAESVLPVVHRPLVREGEPRSAGLRDYYQPETLPVEYLPVRREVEYLPLRREVEYTDFPTEYRSSAGVPADYRASRSLLAEYEAARISTENLAPTNGFRRAGNEYRSSRALRDYHSQRSTHRY